MFIVCIIKLIAIKQVINFSDEIGSLILIETIKIIIKSTIITKGNNVTKISFKYIKSI